jgi:hypothetical protein
LNEDEFLSNHPGKNEAIIAAWQKREAREEIRNGLIRMTLAQVMVGKKKSGGSFKIEDFVPDWCIEKKPSSKELNPDDIVKMFSDIMEKK